MLMMKLVSTYFISVVFLILDMTRTKSINSYTAKLQQNILLESEKVNSKKILELKPLYDYAIAIFKLKLARTKETTDIQSRIQLFSDLLNNLDDNYFAEISRNFLEKYSKNLETEVDYAEISGAIKKKFEDSKIPKSEMKILSNLLTYDFQIIFLTEMLAENKQINCLPADFDYLVSLNKCHENLTTTEEENNNNNNNDTSNMAGLPAETQPYNYNSENGMEVGVILNADESLNLASTASLSSDWDGIVVEGLRTNAVSQSDANRNLKNAKRTEAKAKVIATAASRKSNNNQGISARSACGKNNILNLKDFTIDNKNIEYSVFDLTNQSERSTFYFILAENLELFESQSDYEPNYVFVEAFTKNIFYEVSKKETSEGTISFTHNVQVFSQSFKFSHESNCGQNAHVFLTIDDSFNMLKIVLNIRFTKTYEYNFSKIFVVNLAEELSSEETKENMYLVFNSHFVTSVNLFKNFNFSFAEQISVIYKTNQILLYTQENNLHSVELKNILSSELLSFNNAKYEYEEKLFAFTKYFLQKTENLIKINSKNLQTNHFPGLYSFFKAFSDNSYNSNSESKSCAYVNQYGKCLRCAKAKKLFNFQCFNDCPENSYFNVEANACVKCGKNCRKCANEKCAECKQNFFLNSADGVCMDFCPSDTKLVKEANGSLYCRSCDESCAMCDSKSRKCLNCKGAAFLSSEGSCVGKCPDKFYSDFSKKTCEKCEIKNCKICSKDFKSANLKGKCEVCESGFYKQNGSCRNQCEKGFYAFEVEERKVCKKCPSECAECLFDYEAQKPLCSKCNLKTHKEIRIENSKNLVCENLCADKNTILLDSVCVNCSIDNCDKCGLNSENNFVCEKCQKGFLLKGGKCVAECGSGFYSSEFKSLCEPCPENCISCKINKDSKRLVCEKCENDFYILNNLECIRECPEGYAKTGTSNNIDTNYNNNNINSNENNNNSDLENLRKLSNKKQQKECKLCENASECRRCSELNPAFCDNCYESYFNNNGVCQHNCPKGYFKSKKQCLKCPSGCIECSSENTCSKCTIGFFYKNGLCSSDCGAGWAPDVYSSSCKKCFDSRCAQCFAEDENLCQKCLNGFKLFENVCYAKCPLGYYDNNGFCVKCAKGCLDCESRESCRSCDYSRNLVMYEGKCVENCPAGFYKEYKENVCRQCANKDCLLCDSVEPSKCKIAQSGTVIENAYYDKCPENFVAAFLNVKLNNEKYELLKCFKCPIFCDACEFSPVNSKIQCLKCAGNFELRNGSCFDKWCGENQIKTDNGCFTCPDNLAKKCDDVAPFKSLECQKDFYLNEGKCLRACPEGRYYSKAFMECKNCVDNCAECLDYNLCRKCDEAFLLFENSKCLRQCPYGFSEDYVKGECVKCADNCSECDIDSLTCKKCRAPFLSELGKCVLKCRLGFFENKQENSCEKCSDCNCLKCRESGKECLKCTGDLLIESGRCVESCDKASGYKQIGRRCEKCLTENCEDCDKKATNICKKCLESFYLTEENQCIANCPEGFFINNFNQKCTKCPANCLTCDSNGNCKKCESEKIFFESRCVFNCPQGFKKSRNGEGKLICDKCNENCKNCSENSQCLECEEGLLLNKRNNKCENNCGKGNYLSEGKCEACGSNCEKCVDKENCFECREGFNLSFDKKCVNKCPGNSIHVESKCVECKTLDAKCVKCSQSALDQCTACAEGFYLNNNECVESCPKGYFVNDKKKCQKCSENCFECYDEASCKSCFESFYLTEDQEGQKHCFDSCPSKTYINKQTKTCDKCSENCLYCLSDTNCKTCKKDFLLENGECKSLCSKSSFIDESTGKCEQCEAGCLSCKSKSQCYICQEGLVLKDGICIENCGINYTNFNNQGICVKCDPDCAECNKFNSSICRKCYGNKVLYDGSCIDKCPLGYAEDIIEIPQSERLTSASALAATAKMNKRIEFLRRLTNNINNNTAAKNNKIVKALEKNFVKFANRSEASKHQMPNFSLGFYKVCRKCGKGCEKCAKENSYYQCLQCEEPLALQSGECREACASDNSSVILEGYCTPCEQIHSSLDNCTRCEASQINPNRKTSNNEKIKTQLLKSLQSLKNKSGLISAAANAKSFRFTSLSELKGVYDVTCTECGKSFYLNYINNKCVKECPTQTFKTKTSIGKLVCDVCPEGCKSCKSSVKCTECFEGLKLNGNSLCDHRTGCEGNKMFYSLKFKKCLKCDLDNCLQCDNKTNELKCSLCENGFYLDMKNKVCVKNCPQETYFNYEKNHCGECPENCTLCDSNKQCKKCLDGFLFEDGFCVDRCSENYVEKDFTCKRCKDKNCKICNKNDVCKCELCDESYKLENGECKTLCSNGFYQEVISEDNVQCKPCSDNCDTCLDDKTCLKCLNFKMISNRMLNLFDFNQHKIKYISIYKENKNSNHNQSLISRRINNNNNINDKSTLNFSSSSGQSMIFRNNKNKYYPNQIVSYSIKFFLKNNFCVQDCGENYATDHINQICIRCVDPNCMKCSPENEQYCEACKPNFFLANGQCKSSCPQGSFINPAKNTCEKCNSEFCLECKNAEICEKCKSPKVLLDGHCLNERCPSGFVNVNSFCEKCQVENCENCSQDLSQCYKCKHNFSLVKQKNICVPGGDCPESYYFNAEHKLCEKCPDSNCLECQADNPSFCVKCNSISNLAENKKCESRCQKTFVFVDKKGKCIECDQELKETCLVCDPLNLKRCLRCDQQQPLKYLFKGKCFESCPAKSFWEKLTNECTECPKNCDECTNEYKCDKCLRGFYLNENKECVKACLDGFIANESNQCEKCHTENLCKICDIKDKSKCIECKNGLYIDLANNKCVDMCPAGSLVSGSSCLSCAKDCLECETFDKCKTCKDGFVLYEGKCIENCPLGFVADFSTMQCVPCSIDDCVSCSNDQSKCFKCKDGKALYKNACVDLCPIGTVNNDKNGYCIDCPPKCSACENSSSCKECIAPYSLDQNNLCSLKDCPVGSTMRNNKCVKCGDEHCRICDSDNLNTCFSCMQDNYLLKDSCKFNCPDGYYQDEKRHKCIECLSNCLTCDDAGKCITCKDGFFNLKSSSCIRCQDLGYALATNGKDCIQCKVNNCQKCDSNSDSICQQCQKGFYITEDSQCSGSCPTGYFKSNSEGILKCLQCGSGCLKCDSRSACTQCDKGFILGIGSCSKKCPMNNYELNGKCFECKDKNCLNCLSENNGKTCVSCKPGTTLFNGECRSECPEGFYANSASEVAVCKECGENCEKCKLNEVKTGAQCQQCEVGFNLFGNKCISKCGPGKYENKEKNGQCEKCNDENCLVCLNAETCRKCNTETLLYIKGDENACLGECPMGYYKNKQKRICEKCQANCKVCANGNSCITCNERFYLFEKNCVDTCPKGYGVIEHSCEKCTDEFCSKCHNNDNTKCKECLPGKFLLYEKCVDADICFKHSKYPDKIKNKCKRCDGKCKVCLDKHTCLDCYEEFKARPKNKKINEITVSLLPEVIKYFDKQYTIPIGNNGDNSIDYYDCYNPCPDNKVINLDTNSCVCCKDPTCKDCINKGEKCLSCMGQSSILDGKCLKSCPAAFFKDLERGKCAKCPIGCEECINSEQCVKCSSGFYLHADAQCQKYCADKFYPDPEIRKCLACDAACEICHSRLNKNCQLCAEGYFKFRSQCIMKSECPKGTYVNYEIRECSQCPIHNCAECSERKKCNVCKDNYTLSKDSTQCIAILKFFNVIDRPNMYSKYQIENKASKVNQTLTEDFRISCNDPRSFSVSFWTRVITDDIKDGSVLVEVTHPFYEQYLKQNRNLKYNSEQFSYPGFYVNLKVKRVEGVNNDADSDKSGSKSNNDIALNNRAFAANSSSEINKEVKKALKVSEFKKLQKLKKLRNLQKTKDENSIIGDLADIYKHHDGSIRYKCVSEIMYLTNQNEIKQNYIENEYCDFLMLKEWTLTVLSINLLEDEKLTFKLSLYDSVLQYAYNSTTNIDEKFYFEKEINVISASTFILLDKQYELMKVPIFEVSKFKIHEFTLLESELADLYKTMPLSCDVNCVRCENDICLQCKNNKVTADGYCEATYLPISNNLLELEKPQSFILSNLNQHLLYKYISSDRYSFITWFHISSREMLSRKHETLLFKLFYYNGINLIEIKLIGSELVLIINGKFQKAQGFELQLSSWYGINISISKDTFYVIIRDEQNEDLVNIAQSLDGTQYLMRLTHDTEFYFYGGKTNSTIPESQWAIAKTLIYINNIYLDIPEFSCSANCAKCDKKLQCVFCDTGYTISKVGKGCKLEENLNPIMQVKRKSLYDFEGEIIEYPNELGLNSITMSCWMRKTLPSKPGTKTNLLGLLDPVEEEAFPILSQEIDEQGVTKYIINLSAIEVKTKSKEGLIAIEDLNNQKKQLDRVKEQITNSNKNSNLNKNLFKKFNMQRESYLNTTLFKNNLELDSTPKIFNYTVKYENNTFNYIHVGMNLLRVNETGEFILTFALYDPFAEKNFTTKMYMDLQFINLSQLFIGDKKQPNINMVYGPIRYYKGNTLKDPQLYNKLLRLTVPKSCDPSCRECDYNTGNCLLCASSKITNTQCDTFMFGFTKSMNYNNTRQKLPNHLELERLNKRTTHNDKLNKKDKDNIKHIYNRKFRKSQFASLLSYSDPSYDELGNVAQIINANNATDNLTVFDRNKIEKDQDFSTSFNEFFDVDMNSNVYSVIGWIYIISSPNKGKENIIFRLSNCDYGNMVLEDDKNYIYDSGLNLITLKAKFLNEQEKPEFTFVLGDGDNDIEIPTGVQPQNSTWYFVYSGKNTTGMFFDFSISQNSEQFTNLKRVSLKAVSQPIQEVTSLKLFGVDSVSNANSEFARAVAYNLYMIPNIKDADNTMKDFHMKIDPTKPNVFSQCDNTCDQNSCVLDTCFKCRPGYYLNNEHCVKVGSSNSYAVLIDQKNMHKSNHKLAIDPILTVNGSYAFQFFIRRNYHPRFTVLENDNSTLHEKKFDFEANREIVKFGNFKLSFLNTINGAKLNVDIESPGFAALRKLQNITTEISVYQSNDYQDFEWHYIQIFINRTIIEVVPLEVESVTKFPDDTVKLVIPHSNLVKEDFRELFVDGLENEFTISGFIFLQADKNVNVNKNALQKPSLDCPIDCTLCDTFPNNVCLKCDYGNQCTLNNSKDNLCKFRFVSLPSFYLWSLSQESQNELLANQASRFQNGQEPSENQLIGKSSSNSEEGHSFNNDLVFANFFSQKKQDDFSVNYVKFSYLYGHLLNKIVRFKSFTLIFAVSIHLSEQYDSIVKILNYDKEKSGNYLSNFGEFEFMNLRFDTTQRLFMFSHSNKNIIRTAEDSSSYTIKGYKRKSNLNQYHYIAISYNEAQRLFSFVILNSKDNYIVDNLTTNGNMDYLGTYSHLIFGDGFKKANKDQDAESKIVDVRFMHETALNTLELINELQKSFDINYLHGCKRIDIRSNQCLKCDEGLMLVKGICHQKFVKDLEVYKSNIAIDNYNRTEADIFLNYEPAENPTTSFTVSFMYLQMENTPKLSGLLKFSAVPKNGGETRHDSRNIIQVLERENSFIFALSPFSDPEEFVYFFIDNIYKIDESYSWLHISIFVNLSLKSFNVHIYNYKSLEMSYHKFDYVKQFEAKEPEKNFNILHKKPEQKFAFRFSFKDESMTIQNPERNVILNESAEHPIKYKMSTFSFYCGTELESNSIRKILPLRPITCVCTCKCINDICPINCSFDYIWIKYQPEKDVIDKSLTFQNFFRILENSSRRFALEHPDKGTSVDLSDYDRVTHNNYFTKASISFKLDYKKYTKLLNKWTSTLFQIPFFVEHMKHNYDLDKYLKDLELAKQQGGEFDFSYNEVTREFLSVLNKALDFKHFREQIKKYARQHKLQMLEDGFNGSNLEYVFCLSDDMETSQLKHGDEITMNMVKDSILTMKADFRKLIIFVGADKFSDTAFTQELDFQTQNSLLRLHNEELLKIEQIYVYLKIDMKKNMLKVILFLNDMRKDFEFKFSHKTDYIGYFSSIFVNPSVEDLIMNVGETSIAKHLHQIRDKIASTKFKKKFCNKDCDGCFVGSKKYLRKCLVCGEGKSMYNSNCMKSKNIALHPMFRKIKNGNEKKSSFMKNKK